MRPQRRRFFGHPVLVHYLQVLGAATNQQGLGTLLIGDLGQPRGGPMPFGHRSHQIGLDADIWFWLPGDGIVLSAADRETLGPAELGARSKRRQWRLKRRGIRIRIRCKDAERIHCDRRLEEPARALVGAHEPIELLPEAIVVRAYLGEECPPLFDGACDGRLK